MHRPSPRIMRAALVAHVVGMLGATEHIKNIFRPSARRHRRGGAAYPRQSEREKLRRQLGGFSRLHDHTVYYVGEPYVYEERRCPICDKGKSHAEAARAA